MNPAVVIVYVSTHTAPLAGSLYHQGRFAEYQLSYLFGTDGRLGEYRRDSGTGYD